MKKEENVHKLLFLDIDGVLNNRPFYEHSLQYKLDSFFRPKNARQYDLKKLNLLKKIHEVTNCTFVMSSSWRALYFNEDKTLRKYCKSLKKDLKKRGIEILYKTSNNYDSQEYMKQNGAEFVKNDKGLYDVKWVEIEKKKTIDKLYERGYQIYEFIKDWEQKHGPCTFAILDDDCGDLSLFNQDGYVRFVQTKWYGTSVKDSGVTEEHVNQVIQILNNENPPPHNWLEKLY